MVTVALAFAMMAIITVGQDWGTTRQIEAGVLLFGGVYAARAISRRWSRTRPDRTL